MKIKVYIVTYKKNDVLNANLKSLWACAKEPQNIDVTVLANHPDVVIDNENNKMGGGNLGNSRVVINTTRMPNAWGHLSRDWNFCLLDAFKTWENPEKTDWAVLAQNDVTWVDGWDEWVRSNRTFDFVSQPRGDQCMVLNINAVKKIGFFDERFTTLHRQELDFFIRACYALNNRCSINDDHNTVDWSYNPVGNVITKSSFSGINLDSTLHNAENMQDSISFFASKWNVKRPVTISEVLMSMPKPPKEINWYPFFFHGYEPIKITFLNNDA